MEITKDCVTVTGGLPIDAVMRCNGDGMVQRYGDTMIREIDIYIELI